MRVVYLSIRLGFFCSARRNRGNTGSFFAAFPLFLYIDKISGMYVRSRTELLHRTGTHVWTF